MTGEMKDALEAAAREWVQQMIVSYRVQAETHARAGYDNSLHTSRAAFLASLLSTDKAVGEWQPMETAPKDGTRIILAWGGRSVVGYWLDNSASKQPWAGWKAPSMEVWPTGQPTDWQPMPTPPALTASRAILRDDG
jgi:hypothetical protein